MMTDQLAPLADRMVRSRTIGFIGAGASVRLGFPLWKDLISALYSRAVEYNPDIPRPVPSPDSDSSPDYRWLAEVYGEVISLKTSLTETLNSIFADHQRKHPWKVDEPGRLHDLIARLPFKHFITTNYDRFIEDACDRVFEATEGRKPAAGERCLTRDGRVSDAFSGFLGAFSHDTQRSVLHLHGTMQGEHLTLSLAEYNEQYLQDAMLMRMFSIFATSTIVFIGASLQDADLMELVRRSTYHAGGRVRHYAFVTDNRKYERDLLRRNFGIEPIFYSRGPDDNHEELERHLEHLLELVEPLLRRGQKRADGNARPVNVRHVEELEESSKFEKLVGLVKDEIRRVRGGAAKISGLSDFASSRVLRRIASDYRDLPISYRFHHVIWISPGRIGLFPDDPRLRRVHSRSRRVLHSIIGEIVYSLGRQRVTGTSDPMVAIRSIRRVIEGRRWKDAEPILFIIDGFEELATKSGNKDAFDELLYLPGESVALYRRPSGEEPSKTSRVDPVDEEMAQSAAGNQPDWAKPIPIDVCVSLIEEDHPDPEHTSGLVLAALCLVATPITAEKLALMLELTLGDLDVALEELIGKGLIEANTKETPGWEALSEKEVDTVGRYRGPLGLLNPIRRGVLEEPRYRNELVSIASLLLRWAEATVEGFSNWEEDNAQLDQLTQDLPNVLAIFEACCWLTSLDPDAFKHVDIDRHLWLGTDLSYILYNVGRWAEARDMLDYLAERANGNIPDTDIKAPGPSELDTFHREVLILQSRYLEHAGSTQQDFVSAVAKAEEAIQNADKPVDQKSDADKPVDQKSEHEPVDNTYAPNRLTLARQRARAEIARALALLKTGEVKEAESKLRPILFDRDFDGPRGISPELDEQRNQRESQRESQLIVADASRALAGVRIAQLEQQDPNKRGEVEQLKEIFRELDEGQNVLSALNNRRARGHTALRRGEILYRLDNLIAARRYYARSLLIAVEFRDRLLEAGATLGLANCDFAPELARSASHIYEDLGMEERKSFAKDCELRLRHQAERWESAARPILIVVVGIPGTGKSVVARTVGEVLPEWGYEPHILKYDLFSRLREGENVETEVKATVIEALQANVETRGRPVVGLIKVPTGRPKELFGPWIEEGDVIGKLLCIRLEGSRALLRDRNERRRSGQLTSATLEKMIHDLENQHQTPLGFSSWESAFQANGGAMVTVNAGGSILDLEGRIRDALALSFLSYHQLIGLEISEGLVG